MTWIMGIFTHLPALQFPTPQPPPPPIPPHLRIPGPMGRPTTPPQATPHHHHHSSPYTPPPSPTPHLPSTMTSCPSPPQPVSNSEWFIYMTIPSEPWCPLGSTPPFIRPYMEASLQIAPVIQMVIIEESTGISSTYSSSSSMSDSIRPHVPE